MKGNRHGMMQDEIVQREITTTQIEDEVAHKHRPLLYCIPSSELLLRPLGLTETLIGILTLFLERMQGARE